MKIFYGLTFIFIACVLSSYVPNQKVCGILLPTSPWKDENISEEDEIVYESLEDIFNNTEKSLTQKYKLKVCGRGASAPENEVRRLSLMFYSPKLSQVQMRALLVEFCEELLHNINSNIKIQPFLVKRPFTIENVGITFLILDNGKKVCDPDISRGNASYGRFTYQTNDPENEFATKNVYEETYEEALSLFRKECQPKQ